jgi:hypothetical protein
MAGEAHRKAGEVHHRVELVVGRLAERRRVRVDSPVVVGSLAVGKLVVVAEGSCRVRDRELQDEEVSRTILASD